MKMEQVYRQKVTIKVMKIRRVLNIFLLLLLTFSSGLAFKYCSSLKDDLLASWASNQLNKLNPESVEVCATKVIC